MKVTKHRCTACEGEGELADVVRHGGDRESALPASAAGAIKRAHTEDEKDDYEPDECRSVVEASAPYPCRNCNGPGFYFYVEDGGRSGELLLLNELPNEVHVVGVEGGTPEWREHHEGKPANFIWMERHYETSN